MVAQVLKGNGRLRRLWNQPIPGCRAEVATPSALPEKGSKVVKEGASFTQACLLEIPELTLSNLPS